MPITRGVLRVLAAIHEAPAPISGLGICRATGKGSGTVYPILVRLERAGWIGSKPHPNREGALVYHLTYRGQLRAGFEPAARE
ncbi:helix-turn-helix transcriptional regulator [Streptomyces parvulus]|uniref:helix-turn-helix transcriptional regulator n=1 Tax=Streptomyces parvulus TaxID=146923 RepID=UPI0037014DF9